MVSSKIGLRTISALVAAIVLVGESSTANARGGWHGAGHAGGEAHAAGGGDHAAGGRRHGNDSYMKAASAERDKLLNNKLKSICRGC